MYIEGFLRTNKWKDKNDNERYSTDVIANNLQMLDIKQLEGSNDNESNWGSKIKEQDVEKDKLFEDEIPF